MALATNLVKKEPTGANFHQGGRNLYVIKPRLRPVLGPHIQLLATNPAVA